MGREEQVPWRARFKTEFEGLRVPFGARVHYVPAPGSRVAKELKPFDDAASTGIFLDWVMEEPISRWDRERAGVRVPAEEDDGPDHN